MDHKSIILIFLKLIWKGYILYDSNEQSEKVTYCMIQMNKLAGREIPFQGLTLGNKLSEETHVLTKQETLLERGTYMKKQRVMEPKRTALPHGSQFSSVQFSHSVVSDSLRPHGLQHSRLLYPSLIPGACSNSCPSSRWCHSTISFSVIPFSSCLQSFPASGSFPRSQLLASGSQVGVSASASVLPVNIQDWFPLGWTGWISLQSKEISRVFSNTTAQKHPFFGT